MASPIPLNTSSDDAAIFSSNLPDPNPMSSDDDDSDTEDPVGRGQSYAGRVDMFRPKKTPRRYNTVKGGNAEPSQSILMTPGAHLIP